MWTALVIGYFLTWLLIPHILTHKKWPLAILTWLWALLLFPYLGAIAYFVFGVDRMQRKRQRRREEFRAAREQAGEDEASSVRRLDEDNERLLFTLSALNGIETASADHMALLIGGHAFYARLKECIENAQHHIHIEFYTWGDDECGREFRDLLIAAAQRGVEVRVLADLMGSIRLGSSFFDSLIEAGGSFSFFRTLHPLKNRFTINLRNHRKLQIFDAQTAFVGGMNMSLAYTGDDPKVGPWRDMQLEVRGDIVSELADVFDDDWYYATEEALTDRVYYERHGETHEYVVQAIAGGPDLENDPLPKSTLALLGSAKKRIWIATGYFVPDKLLIYSLQIAAARGVDVRLLIARKTDHPFLVRVGRSYYDDLLEGGVRVFEYSQAIHHAKAMAIDSEWLMVGSANFDLRSMELNFELNLLAHAPELALELERAFEEDFNVSKEIILDEFKNRPWTSRALEATLRPLAPLL